MIIFMFVIVSSLIELSETLKLIKKAVSIANNVYQKKYLTSVVWKHCDDIVVTNFLQLYEGSVVTVEINKDFDSNKIDFHKNVLYQQTVFFAVDAAEFEYFLKVINRIIVVPIKVIIVIANRELSTDFAAEFTKTAWDNDVGSIVVMGNINETIELITYFPYDNGGCGNYTPVHLNSGTTKYFKPKFRNFNGCPIRASLLEFIPYVKLKIENDTAVAIGGLDGNLLKLIIEVLNSTMDIMSANSHGVISTCVNGTRVGTFNDLVYNIADIMAPSFIIVPISLIVRISYQGKLIDGLRNTILEPPTKTLAEAIEVVDGIGGMPTFIELYKNTSIEHKYNQIKLRELPNYMKEVGAGRRYLLAVDMVQVKYYRHKLQILEERVTSVPACIHMRPRWPAAPEISHLIGRMVDSGLIVKIWKDITNEWLLLHGLEHTTNTVKPLDIKTLSSCFYGLIIMYFVSGFVFCLEIILKRYKSKHREVMEK
ncbi:jg22113 [Pararge aegeria aegeria]|uniref:Jg22113 protein n=1 Tax=Pararge aegeria aegeria TaxID=348720 RepID=A0A8S4QGQ8_9NEOP|nr:jg22113 [Pararge aegeria aegeria]